MSKGKILVVDSDENIRQMLNMYFTGQDYEVVCVPDGQTALKVLNEQSLPKVIILEVELPGMTGIDVCREIRNSPRARHIPVIFLAQMDEINKRMARDADGDDFITKPFDIEELKLRIQNVFPSIRVRYPFDPISNLPKGYAIEEHLRKLLKRTTAWVYVDIKILDLELFIYIYGWQKADELLKDLAEQFKTIVKQFGTVEDFIGHPGSDNFVVITQSATYEQLIDKLAAKINETVIQYYSQADRERGYIGWEGKQVPLMTLAWGCM